MKIKLGYLGAGVIIGLLVSWPILRLVQAHRDLSLFSDVGPVREKDSNYKFINPLLSYDLPESKEFGEYLQLSRKLSDLIDSDKNQNLATDVSVYFRNSKGRWVGINDNERYYPASLLKVVVMMAYYQQAQTNPEILDKQLTYTPEIQNQVTTSEFNTPSTLKLGDSYKIDDLIRGMIVDSDNGATFTLINSLNGKDLDEIYSDFGLKSPNSTNNYEISAKDYSLFFRILYNATYLNREYSEKALSLLSQASFKDGLVAGLPAKTVVAHKFGEHIVDQSTLELHDCGLIYAKQSFLLCVMTRGGKVEDLERVIRDITALAYKEAE